LAGHGQYGCHVVVQQQTLEQLAVDLPLQLSGRLVVFSRSSQVKLALIGIVEADKRFVVCSAQLRPQCERNWEGAVKLTIAFQLPARKPATKLRLQLY
jgi:hypothetical protein